MSPLPFMSSSRMVGIEFSSSNCPLFIFCVHLPSRSGCTDVLKEALNQVEAAILLLPPGADIIVMGDFNADLGHLGGPMSCTQLNEQGKILHRYLTKWSFVSTHLHLQPNVSLYTYGSDAHSTQSTIDHILCPLGMLPKFVSAPTVTEEQLNTSDHNPVLAVVYHSLSHSPSSPPTSSQSRLFNLRNWADTRTFVSCILSPCSNLLNFFFMNCPLCPPCHSTHLSLTGIFTCYPRFFCLPLLTFLRTLFSLTDPQVGVLPSKQRAKSLSVYTMHGWLLADLGTLIILSVKPRKRQKNTFVPA